MAYAESEERDAVKDMAFDPATKEWSALPDDPLPPTYGRTMAWSGRELVLFAAELVRATRRGEAVRAHRRCVRPARGLVAAAARLGDPAAVAAAGSPTTGA